MTGIISGHGVDGLKESLRHGPTFLDDRMFETGADIRKCYHLFREINGELADKINSTWGNVRISYIHSEFFQDDSLSPVFLLFV